MRRALQSVAIAIAGVAAVFTSGWALQAAALPPPKPAARVAADASAWFHEYRLSVDIFHFDHRRIRGACLRGWFRRSRGPKARESRLSLRPRSALLPVRLAAAAGCTGKLEGALGAAAQGGAHLTAERAYAANRPAIELRWARSRDAEVTLFVSPRTDQPLVASMDNRGRHVTARFYLARARPRLLARFHLPVTKQRPRTAR